MCCCCRLFVDYCCFSTLDCLVLFFTSWRVMFTQFSWRLEYAYDRFGVCPSMCLSVCLSGHHVCIHAIQFNYSRHYTAVTYCKIAMKFQFHFERNVLHFSGAIFNGNSDQNLLTFIKCWIKDFLVIISCRRADGNQLRENLTKYRWNKIDVMLHI